MGKCWRIGRGYDSDRTLDLIRFLLDIMDKCSRVVGVALPMYTDILHLKTFWYKAYSPYRKETLNNE